MIVKFYGGTTLGAGLAEALGSTGDTTVLVPLTHYVSYANNDIIRIDREYMLITSKTASQTLNVKRGYLNSFATTHAINANIRNLNGRVVNLIECDLAADMTAAQSTADVATIASYDATNWIKIDKEWMYVLSETASTLTVTRSSFGTTAAVHDKDANIYLLGAANTAVITVYSAKITDTTDSKALLEYNIPKLEPGHVVPDKIGLSLAQINRTFKITGFIEKDSLATAETYADQVIEHLHDMQFDNSGCAMQACENTTTTNNIIKPLSKNNSIIPGYITSMSVDYEPTDNVNATADMRSTLVAVTITFTEGTNLR